MEAIFAIFHTESTKFDIRKIFEGIFFIRIFLMEFVPKEQKYDPNISKIEKSSSNYREFGSKIIKLSSNIYYIKNWSAVNSSNYRELSNYRVSNYRESTVFRLYPSVHLSAH